MEDPLVPLSPATFILDPSAAPPEVRGYELAPKSHPSPPPELAAPPLLPTATAAQLTREELLRQLELDDEPPSFSLSSIMPSLQATSSKTEGAPTSGSTTSSTSKPSKARTPPTPPIVSTRPSRRGPYVPQTYNKSTRAKWTKAEDDKLLELIKHQPPLSWTAIADQLEGRKSGGVQLRWYNFLRALQGDDFLPNEPAREEEDSTSKSWCFDDHLEGLGLSVYFITAITDTTNTKYKAKDVRSGPVVGRHWTPEEDRALRDAVAKFGPNWGDIAKELDTEKVVRSIRSYRERYFKLNVKIEPAENGADNSGGVGAAEDGMGSDVDADGEMDPTDVATATAETQLRTKDWTVRNDRILAGLVQFEPPLGWHDIACRLGIGADIPACQLRWQALRKAAGSAPKVNSSLEGLGDDDNDFRPSPSTRNDRSQSRHLAASGSAPSGAYTVRLPILTGRERNNTKHNLTYTGPHVPTLNLPPVALVVNPPVPFTAQSVIRGRRTLSPTALAGTLFSPNGKIKKVHTCPAANCGSAFKRSEHLKRHYRAVHVGSKPYSCEWPGCDKTFSRRDNLQQHLAMVHGQHPTDKLMKKIEDLDDSRSASPLSAALFEKANTSTTGRTTTAPRRQGTRASRAKKSQISLIAEIAAADEEESEDDDEEDLSAPIRNGDDDTGSLVVGSENRKRKLSLSAKFGRRDEALTNGIHAEESRALLDGESDKRRVILEGTVKKDTGESFERTQL